MFETKKLRESESRLKELTRGLPLLVWGMNLDRELEFVNDYFVEFFGISLKELQKTGWQPLIHPDDTNFISLLEDKMRQEVAFVEEVRVIHVDGGYRHLEVHVKSRITDSGKFAGYLGTSVDITERLLLQKQTAEQKRRLETALEVGLLGEWFLYPATGVAHRNERHDEIFGYAEMLPEWSYDLFLEHVHPDDRELVDSKFRRALENSTEWSFETRIIHPDSSIHWIWARGQVVKGDAEEATRMSGIVQDITERKQQEEGNRFLAKIAAPLNTLVDYKSTLHSVAKLAVPFLADWCMIALLDENGRLNSVTSVSGTNDGNIATESFQFAWDPGAESILSSIIETREARRINGLTDEDLEQFASSPEQLDRLRAMNPTCFVGVPMVARGKCFGVFCSFMRTSGRYYSNRDLALVTQTTRRISNAIENARLYAAVRDADERKTVFLAMLGHELRNPLSAISAGLELLESGVSEADSKQTLEMLSKQKDHVSHLIDDLMDVSRISQGKILLETTTVDIRAVVENAVGASRFKFDQRQQQLDVHLGDEAVVVRGDQNRLEQVVSNLLSNASKYTPPQGAVTLSVASYSGKAVIRVSDSGIGIDATNLKGIFGLFEQITPQDTVTSSGLGLGLALVQELVQMHGGEVSAVSEGIGEGSTFVVALPLLEKTENTEREVTESQQALKVAPKRILLIDDNRSMIEPMKTLLERRQHQVGLAFDGASGIAAAEQQKPDVILLDIGLPDMTGYDVASQIRSLPALHAVRIVALTGYGQEDDRQRSLSAGFDDHYVKPLDLETVLQIVQGEPDP